MILYLVLPCFNEQEILISSAKILRNRLENLIDKKIICKKSKILFVDDGSKDNTWNIIENLNRENNIFCGIKLSRNYGHQNALLCAFLDAKKKSDAVICIDADLQDDIDIINIMIEKFINNNCEIVYGVRNSRESDNFFKKITAELFYKIQIFLGCEIIFNHADFRLMSKRVLDSLENFEERNLFLRGIIPMIGFKSCEIKYSRKKRKAGKTKYNLKRMLLLAINGVVNLTIKPIRMIEILGLIILLFGLLLIFLIRSKLICLLIIFDGLIIFSLGIIGEYIGNILFEIKKRPRYFIEKKIE
jgi:glycosyltransferase involved in cell wall biosynthesis